MRQQISSSFYKTLSAENVLCFAGAEEGIFASLYTLCDPSDHVIVLTPCYQSLVEIPKLKGAQVTMIELCEEDDWRIDIGKIKESIKANTKCVVINFPHNPTGQIITQDELNRLISLCDFYGIWIFSDEVYRLLGAPSNPWAKPVAEVYPRGISLGVMSKAFGMGGLRVGWIACQDTEMLSRIKKMKDYLSICNSAPSEILSLIALKNKDKILARNNCIVAENLALLESFFDEYKNIFSWVKPQGGCVGFVKYKRDELVDEFCKRLLESQGVLLIPASIYDHNSNHFRIGFGRNNMPDALDRLDSFLAAI